MNVGTDAQHHYHGNADPDYKRFPQMARFSYNKSTKTVYTKMGVDVEQQELSLLNEKQTHTLETILTVPYKIKDILLR